jgi:hypothetical protein
MSYMDEMMSRLLAILAACTAAGAEEDHGAVDMALSAVASAAAAAEEGFAPYAPSVLPILRQFMSLTKVRVVLLFLNVNVINIIFIINSDIIV